MSVNVSPFDIAALAQPRVPAYVRASGGVDVGFGVTGRGTKPLRLVESGGYRIKFPRVCGACEAVIINSGGGMAGGDRMSVDVTVDDGAAAVVTTQAAEKLYRTQGPDIDIAVQLRVGNGSELAWLPQEAILFSGARVRRTVAVALAAEASLVFVESVVLGRAAMGERYEAGAVRDRWRIRRDGRLVFAEDVRLDGFVAATLARGAVAAGGLALATVLVVAADAEGRIDAARLALEDATSESGASAWNGMLVARLLARDAQALRADLARLLARLRGTPMPRSWQT